MLNVVSPLAASEEQLVTEVVDCGFQVHAGLGPGFRESIYASAFRLELNARGLSFECEKAIEVCYKNWTIPGQRVDLLVGGVVLVEIKAVPKFTALHRRQVLSYLKTMHLHVGLLINFNSTHYKHGVKRVVL